MLLAYYFLLTIKKMILSKKILIVITQRNKLPSRFLLDTAHWQLFSVCMFSGWLLSETIVMYCNSFCMLPARADAIYTSEAFPNYVCYCLVQKTCDPEIFWNVIIYSLPVLAYWRLFAGYLFPECIPAVVHHCIKHEFILDNFLSILMLSSISCTLPARASTYIDAIFNCEAFSNCSLADRCVCTIVYMYYRVNIKADVYLYTNYVIRNANNSESYPEPMFEPNVISYQIIVAIHYTMQFRYAGVRFAHLYAILISSGFAILNKYTALNYPTFLIYG